jgi:hypothetical protein
MERRKELTILPKHPEAKGSPHDFQGISFEDTLERHIKDYLKHQGEYR